MALDLVVRPVEGVVAVGRADRPRRVAVVVAEGGQPVAIVVGVGAQDVLWVRAALGIGAGLLRDLGGGGARQVALGVVDVMLGGAAGRERPQLRAAIGEVA